MASRVIPVYLSITNPAKLNSEQILKLTRSVNYNKAQREIFGELKMLGHDGAILDDETFVGFNPNQIKSDIGNSGKFDPSDSNIHK
jgi:hypothetical protein